MNSVPTFLWTWSVHLVQLSLCVWWHSKLHIVFVNLKGQTLLDTKSKSLHVKCPVLSGHAELKMGEITGDRRDYIARHPEEFLQIIYLCCICSEKFMSGLMFWWGLGREALTQYDFVCNYQHLFVVSVFDLGRGRGRGVCCQWTEVRGRLLFISRYLIALHSLL